MQVQIKIKNLDKIRGALLKSPQIVSKHINDAIKRAILDLRNEAISTTPVDTGRLRGSYSTIFSQLRGELYPTAKYAIFVHEGHRQQVGRYVPAIGRRLVQPFVKGNPFLKNAIDKSNSSINRRFEDGLKSALDEIARSV